MSISPFSFDPIGVIRSPFAERAEAPRQAAVAEGAQARIELYPGKGYDEALEGLEAWQYIWVLFVFHRNVEEQRGWRPKVLPPRSETKRGLFATRSPHRPNPIGMSAVEVLSVAGRVIEVRNADFLDETPVLDLKPYVAYADAYPSARSGWLEAADPAPAWSVAFTDEAERQLSWLSARGVELRARIAACLALGPTPHAYRRIRREQNGLKLALKEWRIAFESRERAILVTRITTGYRARALANDEALELHRAFARAWP